MPCVEKFQEALQIFNVPQNVIAKICEVDETVTDKSQKKVKAAYFKKAADILSENVDKELIRNVFEYGACCKSGQRLKVSKAFARENSGLSWKERLELISNIPNMPRPVLQNDGTLVVHAVNYWDGTRFLCACSNFHKSGYTDPVSKNYCFCCAGHFKFHYEIMLGVNLQTEEIISSPLDSNGKDSCVIRFSITDQRSVKIQ